jgi:hypothetical protein
VNNDDFSEAESFALSLEEVADLVQVVRLPSRDDGLGCITPW